MIRYNTFLLVFIISIITAITSAIFYFQSIFKFIKQVEYQDKNIISPFEMLSTIFTPQLLITVAIAAAAGLTYRIYAIVSITRNKTISDGEKALWIVGFILIGFVTAIVYLALAKGKKLAE
jgi:hypothetical protein